MKEVILVCDKCKPSIPAVTTLHLSNGKGKPQVLDVCAKHEKEQRKSFMPVRTGALVKANPIKEDDWNRLKSSTLGYVNRHGEVTSKSVQEDVGASIFQVRKLLQELTKEKKITRKGAGPGSSYHKR